MSLKIWADQNIPLVETLFRHIGEVTLFEGRKLISSDLKDADVLLVRSVTKVNESLLKESRVKWVGTATAGIDHLDIGFLESSNIFWTNAPGSNARSVAEYALASWVFLDVIDSIDRLSIWGYGHVGKQVDWVFSCIGKEVIAYDPFLDSQIYPKLHNEIDLFDTDAISLHIPWTKKSLYPTNQKINSDWLSQIKGKVHFLNAGRGEVINENDFIEWHNNKNSIKTVLDVFQNEPNPSNEILEIADIATPHIAGYSYTGKVLGTTMLLKSLEKWLNATHSLNDEMVKKELISDESLTWKEAVIKVYNPFADHQRFIGKGFDAARHQFDALRKDYPKRLEFSDCSVSPKTSLDAEKLASLGFDLV